MEDPPAVAVGEAPQQLEQEQPHVPGAEAAGVLLEVLRQVRVLKRTDGETKLKNASYPLLTAVFRVFLNPPNIQCVT